MARSFGRVLCSIWGDDDFLARSANAQRMYLFLLSQPKLSMVGVLDYMPRRWSKAAPDLELEDIEDALDELAAHRFVVVDESTDELLVRSLVRHDGVTRSWQLLKAMWSAWRSVESPKLREIVVRELPIEAWTNDKAFPPAEAVDIRSFEAQLPASAQVNIPSDTPSDMASDDPCDGNPQLPKPSSSTSSAADAPSDAPSAGRRATPSERRLTLIEEIVEALAQRRRIDDTSLTKDRPTRWRKASPPPRRSSRTGR